MNTIFKILPQQSSFTRVESPKNTDELPKQTFIRMRILDIVIEGTKKQMIQISDVTNSISLDLMQA